ncbi:MAG: acetyl-CoA hydrolase/transferase C-terminal domain-containing protein [Pseudohongiella sp.]|nr:acetyl-CoA hydrolase/transferase C-terminal domain-containing protein [Pseudohongiella sp.]MDP2285093.1 acetyl-CoA hydrolase/transferase C-terminal domain-containing protein [Pseudohongiella sp.]
MAIMCASAAEAVRSIKSGDRIWCQSMAATPYRLLEALAQHAQQLSDVQLLQLHLEQAESVCAPALDGHLRNRCFFVGASTRELVNSGRADYVPVFLSDIPRLFRSGDQGIDVALIQVSPPDRHGNCSLGISVEASMAACEMASTIIAQINPQMPRTHGDASIPLSKIHVAVTLDSPVVTHDPKPFSDTHKRIGEHIAGLIKHGDCLQMGIGAIPDAALAALHGHRHLGIHTEMFSNGVLPLLQSGVIDNSRKVIQPGKTVTSFAMGSRAFYDFLDDNTEVLFLDVAYVNSPAVIRKNPQTVSINSAIQIDLGGQVSSDSIGNRIYSGFGGQVDFVTGSQLSAGGRSIIALPATAKDGSESRITAQLSPGAGVVTSRAQVDYVVTEYGVARLRGTSLRERAQLLIGIAHPDFREMLQKQFNHD